MIRSFVTRYYSVFVILIIWEVVARLIDNAVFFPAPTTVAGVLGELLKSGDLVEHTAVSTFRALSGFGLAAVLGIPPRDCHGALPLVGELLEPIGLAFVSSTENRANPVVHSLAGNWQPLEDRNDSRRGDISRGPQHL